jgi:hypothetical protein
MASLVVDFSKPTPLVDTKSGGTMITCVIEPKVNMLVCGSNSVKLYHVESIASRSAKGCILAKVKPETDPNVFTIFDVQEAQNVDSSLEASLRSFVRYALFPLSLIPCAHVKCMPRFVAAT